MPFVSHWKGKEECHFEAMFGYRFMVKVFILLLLNCKLEMFSNLVCKQICNSGIACKNATFMFITCDFQASYIGILLH